MDYTQEMFLLSKSGYAMPFKEDSNPVNVLLPYGNVEHPKTRQMFFHKGWDIETKDYVLQALATGVVIGITTNEEQGMSLVIRYGKYDVTYSHIQHCLVKFGDYVAASMPVATSRRFFHLGIKMGGEDVDPQDFLTMIYGNMLAFQQAESENTVIPVNSMDVHTRYDENKEEIESFLVRFLPSFMGAVATGSYKVPQSDRQSLENVFSDAYKDHSFYETAPSLMNPLGLGLRAKRHVEDFYDLIIGLILRFAAVTQNIYLSSATEEDKKKYLTEANL